MPRLNSAILCLKSNIAKRGIIFELDGSRAVTIIAQWHNLALKMKAEMARFFSQCLLPQVCSFHFRRRFNWAIHSMCQARLEFSRVR